MQGDQHPKRAELRQARARAIEQLTTAFTRDELGLEEFEARLNLAYAANAPSELAPLVTDLSAAATRAVEPAEGSSVALATATPSPIVPRTLAVLGSVERRGVWSVPSASRATAVLGSIVIDLRDVQLPAGTTTLEVAAVLGSIEIIVPPQIAVESEGVGILGSFEGLQRLPRDPDPELPVLRVRGRAVLGSIEIRTRPAEARMTREALPAGTPRRFTP